MKIRFAFAALLFSLSPALASGQTYTNATVTNPTANSTHPSANIPLGASVVSNTQNVALQVKVIRAVPYFYYGPGNFKRFSGAQYSTVTNTTIAGMPGMIQTTVGGTLTLNLGYIPPSQIFVRFEGYENSIQGSPRLTYWDSQPFTAN